MSSKIGEERPFLQNEVADAEDVEQSNRIGTSEGRTRRNERRWFTVAAILLSCISALLGGAVTSRWQQHGLNRLCIERTSQKSPLTNDVDLGLHTIRFNGSLLKETVYRQKGGPAVDAAWNDLGVDLHSVVVPADQAQRVGLLPDQVKIRQEYGGGFPANVEGLHQLHCLNLVRQSLWYNYDYYQAKSDGAFKNNEYILQKHVSHCLDIVRQQLMCTVDIGVMGQVWFQPSTAQFPEAYVDFNTHHVCRNFDDVRKWAREHQIPDAMPKDFLDPPREGDTVYQTIP